MSTDANQRLQEFLSNGTENLRNYLNTNVINNKNTRELERLEQYHLNWKFYDGLHYKDFNHTMISFNYVKAFIDKSIAFTIGEDGCTFEVKSLYNDNLHEDITRPLEELVLYNWRRNNKNVTLHKILQMGSICGDVWIMATWEPKKKFVKLTVLDSRQVFPVFNNGDYNDVLGIQVRQVLETQPNLNNRKGKDPLKLKVTYYTKDKVQTWYQVGTNMETPQYNFYKTGFNNDVEGFSEVENPLKQIPIVHIQNVPTSNSYFGKSDCHDILKLNKVYNEMNQEMKGIIDYYATPTTVVTGATLKNMQRGLGKIWSGLPPEANVFTLGLDADLSAMTTFLEKIKAGMHEISDIPEQVLGKIQAFSGTSAAALKLTFQPLVQQADKKALTYGEGIEEINDIILQYHFMYDQKNARLKDFSPDNDQPDIVITPVFSYGFPSDRMNTLQEGLMEQQLGIMNRKNLLNRLGTNNSEDLLKDIKRQTLEDAKLAQKVLLINPPYLPDPNAAPAPLVDENGSTTAP